MKQSDPNDIAELKQKAEQGDSSAQYNIGVRYYNGQDIEQDYKQAAKWSRKAAEQGHASAQFNLGFCYYNGQGVKQNYKKAASWYRKAAKQGLANAQYCLGLCYKNGQGIELDCRQAVYWFRKAAEQGNADAQNNIGICYKYGNGVEQDYNQAVYWYCKAAERGNVIAQFNLGICYDNGQGIEQDYKQAADWYRKAAEQGFASAQFNLGFCYAKGEGVIEDFVEAYKWILLAEKNGVDVSEFKKSLQDKLKLTETAEESGKNWQQQKYITIRRGNMNKESQSNFIKTLKENYFAIENNDKLSLEEKVSRIIHVTSATCGVIAAQPIPFADIFILTPIQAVMGCRIAAIYGISISEQNSSVIIKQILSTVGMGLLAQQFAIGLYKTILPFWGAITTIPLVYGLTYAIGQVMKGYFESKAAGKELSKAEMKKIWDNGMEEGKRNAPK